MGDMGAMTSRVRAKWVADRKRRAGCADCGTREGRLDFDHLPAYVKKFDISWGARRTRDVGDLELLAEMQKCEVVCFDCHVKRTASRLTPEGGCPTPVPERRLEKWT